MFVTGRRPFPENGRSIKFDLSLAQYFFALSAVRQLLDFALEGFRLLSPLLFETRFATHVTLPMLRWAGARPGLSVTDECPDRAVMTRSLIRSRPRVDMNRDNLCGSANAASQP